MGSTGTLLGGAVLGMRQDAPATPAQYFSFRERNYDSAAAAGAIRPPSVTTLDAGGTNALMEAERRNERRQANLRRHQGREVYTAGLGASGLAETAQKTLLGG